MPATPPGFLSLVSPFQTQFIFGGGGGTGRFPSFGGGGGTGLNNGGGGGIPGGRSGLGGGGG
jgi:hypothetical protein